MEVKSIELIDLARDRSFKISLKRLLVQTDIRQFELGKESDECFLGNHIPRDKVGNISFTGSSCVKPLSVIDSNESLDQK
jgi:hypothetical protein